MLLYPFDNLYVHILFAVFISMIQALRGIAIEVTAAVVVVVVAVVNVAVAVELAVICTYSFLVSWSFPLSIFWVFQLDTQISSWDKLFWQCACT